MTFPRSRLVGLFGAAALAVGASPLAWSAEPAEAAFDLPETVRFNRDVRTIFSQTCFACHGPDGNTREAGVQLDVREAAIAERDGFRPIVPGDAAASKAYQLIIASDPEEQMPPKDFHTQLSPRDKAMIAKWIDQGAVYEKHWAFLPPVRPEIPAVKHAGAVRNPIDNFVVAKLEKQGLSPAEEAERATLIRRVTLDLTGLPPTPGEVEAFVGDTSDDAYAKVVARLLASPRFGEQQARSWLDAARYADTSGYQYDMEREQWVWRDWVIHAFNSNMPFDRFTVAQIAGDLMPGADDQSLLATGFHRNHPITIEGGVIDEEYRTEYVMDRVVTTTTTWMGLTFTCARCHDHKYDPIGQDDFYSFFAFFNQVPESGLNGFDPKAKIASPLGSARLAEVKGKIAEARETLDRAVAKRGDALVAWERQLAVSVDAEAKALRVTSVAAEGGTMLTRQDDGSYLASGENPANQTYRIDFTLDGTPTKAIRLEALTDASLVGKSTGRAHNGNFVLSEFQVEVAPPGASGKHWTPVKIASAEADYEQNGYPVAAAIDGSLAGGWAVDGNSRARNSAAVFTLEQPVAVGSRVRVSLVHAFGTAHAIGRFRLTVPADGLAPVPAEVRRVLATNRLERDEAARALLSRHLVERFGGPAERALSAELVDLEGQLSKASAATPETMILREMPNPRPTHVLMRGEYDKPIPERPVRPNVPAALGGLPVGAPPNRLGLAEWLVDRDNPLTARVTVNRFWAQLFGQGLVKTLEDFGSQGEYPSHPELLDWLAVGFMESGWDVKRVFRAMVLSGTYRQNSHVSPEQHALDPNNRLLARGPRFRLDAEVIRDSALAVSGLLDGTIGGPSVYPYQPEGLWLELNNRPGYSRDYPDSKDPSQLYRRGLYTFWKRTLPPPSLASFDAPDREFCTVQRSRTNTPLQAFVLLHDPQFIEAARKLAERMIREGGAAPAERIAHGCKLCLARPPSAAESALLQKALADQLAHFQAHPEAAAKLLTVGHSPRDTDLEAAELAAYANVARMLVNLSEFITKG